jgi:hypothetical protein
MTSLSSTRYSAAWKILSLAVSVVRCCCKCWETYSTWRKTVEVAEEPDSFDVVEVVEEHLMVAVEELRQED